MLRIAGDSSLAGPRLAEAPPGDVVLHRPREVVGGRRSGRRRRPLRTWRAASRAPPRTPPRRRATGRPPWSAPPPSSDRRVPRSLVPPQGRAGLVRAALSSSRVTTVPPQRCVAQHGNDDQRLPIRRFLRSAATDHRPIVDRRGNTVTRAAVLHEGTDVLTIEEITSTPLAPREVRVRTKACGLCHSDYHVIDGTLVRARVPTCSATRPPASSRRSARRSPRSGRATTSSRAW